MSVAAGLVLIVVGTVVIWASFVYATYIIKRYHERNGG